MRKNADVSLDARTVADSDDEEKKAKKICEKRPACRQPAMPLSLSLSLASLYISLEQLSFSRSSCQLGSRERVLLGERCYPRVKKRQSA